MILSRDERFLALEAEKKRIIDYLMREGDAEAVERVEALYAKQEARLFEDEEDPTSNS